MHKNGTRVPGRADDHADRPARAADVHRLPARHHRPQAGRGELRASRARLVEVADAERQRIQRNLHDGAQQRLTSVLLCPRPAARVAGRRARRAARRSRSTSSRPGWRSSASSRAACTRRCSPSAGSSRRSRRSRCARPCRSSSQPLPDRRLPEPVEAAAYYVVAEALANVQKHAGARARGRQRDRRRARRSTSRSPTTAPAGRTPRAAACAGSPTASRRSAGRSTLDSPTGAGTRLLAEIPY